MLKEFKAFALRGNVMDLAVAVIIGGAFGSIVASLVDDMLMPTISALLGGVSFTDLRYIITSASGDITEVAIRYGAFIQSIVDFLIIIAFSIFMIMIIKLLSCMKKKETQAPPAPLVPAPEVVLLQEIRDLLKSK